MRGSSAFGVALLGLCLLASSASGQAQRQEPDAVPSLLAQVDSAKHPRIIAELRPDSTVRALWDRIIPCAGEARDTSRRFEQIRFYERDSVFMNGLPIKGEYVPPDTIYLTTGQEREGWVVAHEMLHFMLNSPSYGPKAHDPLGAFITCGLMEFQHPKPKAQTGTFYYGSGS